MEDEDEEMDKNKEVPDFDISYDEYVKDKKVLSIAEIEARQLSNSYISNNFGLNSNGNDNSEFTEEDLMKKQSMKSIDEFEIEGNVTPKSFSKDTIGETTSEGGSETQDGATPLNKNSVEFKPKASSKPASGLNKPTESDETDKGVSTKSLTTGSRSFIPTKSKITSKPFIPSNKTNSTSLTQSTVVQPQAP